MFFDWLSTFHRHSPLRLPKCYAATIPLWGQDCVLCASDSGDSVVCDACVRSLPMLASGCERCAVPLPQRGICGECQRHTPCFDAAAAVFEYRFPVDRLVHRFKYSGDLAVGRWLALRLLESVRESAKPDLIVAPPLTPARLRTRGFNQAIEIAKAVAQELGVRCEIAGLSKVRETTPQPGLGRRERRANLHRAFRCSLALDGERVALVDDVMTTGATADSIARVLKAAGAGEVCVWAVARTPEPAARR